MYVTMHYTDWFISTAFDQTQEREKKETDFVFCHFLS